MAITKNPIYFLWVGALGRLILRYKAFVAGIVFALMVIWFFMPTPPNTVQSVQLRSAPQTAHVQPAPATTQPPGQTSTDCPGVLSPVLQLTETDLNFNPKGCFFYSKVISGRVEFTGPFIGTWEVGPTPEPPQDRTVLNARAKSGTGSATWQYILCAGPKKNMNTLDCS